MSLFETATEALTTAISRMAELALSPEYLPATAAMAVLIVFVAVRMSRTARTARGA